MPLAKEYTLLFNTITDSITTIEDVLENLKNAQTDAETIYLQEEPEDSKPKHIAIKFPDDSKAEGGY